KEFPAWQKLIADIEPRIAAELEWQSPRTERHGVRSRNERRKKPAKYRSPRKKAIRQALNFYPDASDREVCRYIDAEISVRFKGKSWEQVYLGGGKDKKLLEGMISKVRGNMRECGLIP